MLGALTRRSRRRPALGVPAGVTLVELMVTLAIVAVLLAIALPSMRDFVARKRLEGIAQELVTDLRLLKSHQIQNRPNLGTAISFGNNAQKTCYILYVRGGDTQNCNCAAADDMICGGANAGGVRPAEIRQVDIPLETGIQITADRTLLHVVGYNGMPRLNSTLSVALTGANVGEILVSTNAAGVPSICSVSGVFGAIARCDP